jgi:hypothetical protein
VAPPEPRAQAVTAELPARRVEVDTVGPQVRPAGADSAGQRARQAHQEWAEPRAMPVARLDPWEAPPGRSAGMRAGLVAAPERSAGLVERLGLPEQEAPPAPPERRARPGARRVPPRAQGAG